jgi:hypothetical protein
VESMVPPHTAMGRVSEDAARTSRAENAATRAEDHAAVMTVWRSEPSPCELDT